MAFSLTIDGYTFDNPPSGYRKRIDLGNSPQPHYAKTATPFYRSDSQQITLELNGRLNLNDQGDLDELSKLQETAIEGGEVQVDFDPFFSGRGVIEDDPFDQESQSGTYEFSIAINEETTDPSAYPAHATPTTGNTFELGDFDFGFDPETVSQEYNHQTERVDRLQGVAHTSDTKGLVTKVDVEGRVDGGGQAELWSKARSNALAYLSAEFQNGWALLNSLSVQKDDATPDYLQGLFRYSAEFLIVKDPSSGIGETTQFINHDVGDSGTYTSDDDAGSGSDAGGLDFKVLGGTGSLDGEYIDWVTTTITLADNATNYVYIYDQDGDGQGTVEFNQNSFGTDVLPLYEVDTSNGSITDIRDVRDSLLGTGDSTSSDLLFRDEFTIDDTGFSYAQVLALDDVVADPALTESYLGMADFADTFSPVQDGPLQAKGVATFAETLALQDGGSAKSGSEEASTKSWGTGADWDNFVSEDSVVHSGYGDFPGDGILQLGPPIHSQALQHFPFYENSGSTVNDVSGNGNHGTNSGASQGQTGIVNTTAYEVLDGDRVTTDSSYPNSDPITLLAFVYLNQNPTSTNATDQQHVIVTNSSNAQMTLGVYQDGLWYSQGYDGSTYYRVESNNAAATNVWTVAAVRYDGNNIVELLIDGNVVGSESNPPDKSGYSFQPCWGNHPNADRDLRGKLGAGMVIGKFLSNAEIQEYVDVLNSGLLQTQTKTFSDPVQPDLDALQYTLNSQAIDVRVIGSAGTADEETHTVSLDGGSTYSIPWSNSHTDFRVEPTLSTTDATTSPTVDQVGLTGSVSGGGDPDQNDRTTWTIYGAKPDTSGNEYEGGGVVTYPAGD